MKAPTSLFRYILLRTLAALVIFELLVGGLAYYWLLLPLLENHAQSFADLVLRGASDHTDEFIVTSDPPVDGGTSALPFNQLLARELGARVGRAVTVHRLDATASQYWFELDGTATRYVVFDQARVVGARPLEATLAWLTMAMAVALAIAWGLARGLSQPIMSLRAGLHRQARMLPTPTTAPAPVGILELDGLRDEFAGVAEKLVLALSDRTTLLLGLSHELSAPVARLIMAIELHARGLPAAHRTAMQADTDAMRRIIEEFLSAARCLGKTTQGSLSVLLQRLQKLYSDAPRVHFDDVRLDADIAINEVAAERVVVNLIDNALRHTQGAPVRITLTLESEGWLLEVSDTGPGLDEAEIAGLFHPFERRAGSHGAGLGLALARLLADQNGWTLTLENLVPHGIRAQLRGLSYATWPAADLKQS